MSSIPLSPFELDMAQQADALERIAGLPMPKGFETLDLSAFSRIVLTGMGSSDSVTIPFEQVLLRRGLPVWRMQTSTLLETPQIIVPGTLLWVTSQSGRSGEAVALLSQLASRGDITVIAVTNDPESPIARAADHVFLLNSGPESSVSCKSYLNSLAWFHRLRGHFVDQRHALAVSDISDTATSLRAYSATPLLKLDELAARALANNAPRIALVGTGADAVTALTGALILKEASKVCAEGYAGGAFRHGPIELAGPALTALLFGDGPSSNVTLAKLASDLSRTGSIVVTVTTARYEGAEHLPVPSRSDFERMAHCMFLVQRLSVSLAKLTGIVPGKFRFGEKITSQL